MTIIGKITSEFLNFMDSPGPGSNSQLLYFLDQLIAAYYTLDKSTSPDREDIPPDLKPYEIRRKIAVNKLPDYGLYVIPGDIAKHFIDGSDCLVGDAIDDLANIYGDLDDVHWCIENNQQNDAIWSYINRFRISLGTSR